jgi:CDGSH-type Zn-finger protein
MSSTIIPYEDGPLIVRGDFRMCTPDGTPIDAGRATVALCRCGKSAIKPFCDGTHKLVKFRSGADRVDPQRSA